MKRVISTGGASMIRRQSFCRFRDPLRGAAPGRIIAVLALLAAFVGASCAGGGSSRSEEIAEGGTVYALFVPALILDDHLAREAKPHLVRLVGRGRTRRIGRILHPENYLPEYKGQKALEKALRGERLKHDLVLRRAALGSGVSIEGAVLVLAGEGPVVLLLSLEGEETGPGTWRGEGTVKGGMLGAISEDEPGYRSEWLLQPAPASVIYDTMLKALEFLRGNIGEAGGGPLLSKEDYVTYLRSKRPRWPKRGALTLSIDSHFCGLIAEALESGRIEMKGAEFSVSEQVRGTFAEETPLASIDLNVTYEGEQRRATPPTTVREWKIYPRFTGDQIRDWAAEPEEKREYTLAYGGEGDRKWIENLDYRLEELRYIPDVAYLAEHMTTVPEDLQPRAVDWFIRDGSATFFPHTSFEELARIPNPVLFVACLPRMKRTAPKIRERLNDILQEKGYTLKEAEEGRVPMSVHIWLREEHFRMGLQIGDRVRVGQAEKLAETQRVKELLNVSGLEIDEIADYSIPELIAKVLAPMPAEEAQALIDKTPKFKDYLKATDNEKLRALVEEKGLELRETPQ